MINATGTGFGRGADGWSARGAPRIPSGKKADADQARNHQQLGAGKGVLHARHALHSEKIEHCEGRDQGRGDKLSPPETQREASGAEHKSLIRLPQGGIEVASVIGKSQRRSRDRR